jgi:hypothetical protein
MFIKMRRSFAMVSASTDASFWQTSHSGTSGHQNHLRPSASCAAKKMAKITKKYDGWTSGWIALRFAGARITVHQRVHSHLCASPDLFQAVHLFICSVYLLTSALRAITNAREKYLWFSEPSGGL